MKKVKNASSQKIPDQIFGGDHKVPLVAPVEAVQKVACSLLQEFSNQSVENKHEYDNAPKEGQGENQR